MNYIYCVNRKFYYQDFEKAIECAKNILIDRNKAAVETWFLKSEPIISPDFHINHTSCGCSVKLLANWSAVGNRNLLFVNVIKIPLEDTK